MARRDGIPFKQPRPVDDGRGVALDPSSRQYVLKHLGASLRSTGAGALGPEHLEEHLGHEVVAVLADSMKELREGPTGVRGQQRLPRRPGAQADPSSATDTHPPEGVGHRVPGVDEWVLDAAPVADPQDAHRNSPAEDELQTAIVQGALRCDHVWSALVAGRHPIVDLEVAAGREPHARRFAGAAAGQHPQDEGRAVDRHRPHRGAESRHLAGLLVERGGQDLVVEVASVDPDTIDGAYAPVGEGVGQFDQVAHPEIRVALTPQHQVGYPPAVDVTVEAREHPEAGAKLEERGGGGNQLHVRRGVAWRVGGKREDLVLLVGHEDADSVAQVGVSSKGRDTCLQRLRGGDERMQQGREDDPEGQEQSQHDWHPIAGRGMLPALLALASLVGACATPRDAPSEDGALTVVLPRDADELDPRFVRDAYGLKMSRLIFASLVTIDPRTLEVVPDLAERVETLDPVTYRVVLRPGLRFSDGSVLDAADVVATFQGILDERLGSRYAGTYARVVRVQAESERAVRFVLDAPHATFLTDLEMPIVRQEDALRRLAGPGAPEPVGAGPYRLVERVPGRLRLEANPHWHHGSPAHPRVQFVVVRDDNTRALRLLAGAGDVAINAITPLLLPMFEADARFEVRSAPGVGTTYLGFQTEAVPLLVRRAIAHAIDRDALIAAKLGGRARRTESWIPSGHWAEVGLPARRFDRARARQLFEEAGWSPADDGVRGRLVLRVSSDRFRVSVARAIAAMLRDVGLDVVVRPSDSATLLADLDAGRFDLCLLQVPEVFEPHILSWFFASEHIPEGGRRGANRWRLRDAELDAALEAGRRSVERPARVAAYRRVQVRIHALLPVLPLWQEDSVAVVRSGVDLDVPRDGRFGTIAH